MPESLSSQALSQASPTLARPVALGRITRFELPICLFCNRLQNRALLAFFSAISWLGNGPFWLVIAAALFLVEGRAGLAGFLDLLLAGAASLAAYKALKRHTARPRPCDSSDGIHLTVAPLDQYSFPSGHTLHAVAFTLVLAVHHPLLFWCALPFTVLVAMSRVILGLHYPTDVLAGSALGSLLALLVVQF